MAQANVPTDHIDLIPGPNVISNPNEVRLSMGAAGIQVSLNGAAPGAVGGGGQQSDTLTWLASVATFVAAKDATLVQVRYWSQCNSLSTDMELGSVAGSTGTAKIVRSAGTTSLRLRLASGAVSPSFQQVRNRSLAVIGSATVADTLIANCRTTPFAMACQCVVNAVNATAQLAILNISDEATADSYLGVQGATNQTTFSMKVGAAAAVDTGIAIGTLGANLHTLIVISDGTNYRAYIDLATTAVATTLSSNAANAAGRLTTYANNNGTASDCGYDLLSWALLKA